MVERSVSGGVVVVIWGDGGWDLEERFRAEAMDSRVERSVSSVGEFG